jgi:hypothetical protein
MNNKFNPVSTLIDDFANTSLNTDDDSSEPGKKID